MLKIIHAYKAFIPYLGGIQTIIGDIIRGLCHKLDFTVLTSRRFGLGQQNKYDGVPVIRSTSLISLLSLPIAPFYPFQLWYHAIKSDIVDYHFPFPLVDLAVGIWFPRKTGLIIHWHSEIIAQKRSKKFVAPFITRCLKRADKIIVSNPLLIDNSERLKRFKDKCVVIPFGVDVEYLSLLSDNENKKIQEIKDKYPQLILAVGRLISYKGFEVLIKAMKKIQGNLIIVGTGPLESNLKHLIKKFSLSDSVHLYGHTEQRELKFLYHACNVVAFPSITENEAFGVVQLEAMACSKPIVNTSLNTAVPWIARHKQEAITVQPKDGKALAQAIQLLLDQPDMAEKLGKNGFMRVKNIFNQKHFLEATHQVYEQVVNKNGLS